MDCSLPGSSVHGLFQARVLEWVAISFSRSSWPRDLTWVSRIVGRRFSVWATKEVRAGLPQTKKLPGREYNPTHQQIIGLKLLLSKVLPTRARPSFSHHQSLLSGSLHKPLSLLHQRADSRQSGWLLSKSLQAINAGESVEKSEPSYTVGGNAN